MSISANFGDGTLDDGDREMMRRAFSSYSRQERVGLRRFIGTLLFHSVMREERNLRLILDSLDEAPVKRRAGNLRLVTPLCDEAVDKSSF